MRNSLIPMGVVLCGCFQQQISEAHDRDNDGFPSHELGGPDCDDDNAAVFPGAVEICGNNLDDDCSGGIDDAGTGDVIFYTDKDGDGFPGTTPSSSCTAPPGSFPTLASGADCDDTDPALSPGATEVWYDGVDQNCDGNDGDQDGDGFDAISVGGDDCDDGLASVNSGMAEVCNNGVDDDCDGGAGPCAMVGEIEASELVHAVTGAVGGLDVGDYTGDGVPDLMIHGADRSDWMPGPVVGILGTLTWDFGAFHFAGGTGSVATGDIDSNGVLDVVWARDDGLRWQSGPLQGAVSRPDTALWLAAPAAETWLGNLVSTSKVGRGGLRRSNGQGAIAAWFEHLVNGEGQATAIVSIANMRSSGVHDGEATSGLYAWTVDSVTWLEAPLLTSQPVVLPAGVGSIAGVHLLQGERAGWLFFVHEGAPTTVSVVDAGADPAVWTSEEGRLQFSPETTIVSAALCDLTADGHDDVVIGFFEGQADDPTRRGLAVFDGPIDALTVANQPIAVIDDAGIDTLACAEMTGDGVDDIVASDSLNGFTEVLAGRGL